MKTLILLSTLLTSAQAFAGAPLLTCHFWQQGKGYGVQTVVLNLASLDQAASSRAGVFMGSNSAVRYQVTFYPHAFTAEGYTEALNDAGEWVRLRSLSTEAPLQNCELSREIAVGCPGGLMTNCSDPGGHNPGRSMGRPSRGPGHP
jgi:hypothetical protein